MPSQLKYSKPLACETYRAGTGDALPREPPERPARASYE